MSTTTGDLPFSSTTTPQMATWAIPSVGSGYRLLISQSQQSNDPSSDTSRAQEELYKLIGTSSGFIEAQPPAVRRPVRLLLWTPALQGYPK